MLQPIQNYKISATQSRKICTSVTYTTGFSKNNVSSLEFDTSYALLMDEELFENIYYNTISGEIETYVDISAITFNFIENAMNQHLLQSSRF